MVGVGQVTHQRIERMGGDEIVPELVLVLKTMNEWTTTVSRSLSQ